MHPVLEQKPSGLMRDELTSGRLRPQSLSDESQSCEPADGQRGFILRVGVYRASACARVRACACESNDRPITAAGPPPHSTVLRGRTDSR